MSESTRNQGGTPRVGLGSRRRASSRTTLRALLLGIFASFTASGCTAGTGARCTVQSECAEGFVCVTSGRMGEMGAHCMRGCAAETRLCGDGFVCMDFAAGRACYPGGTQAFGEACTTTVDCEAGTVCPAALGVCVQACAVGLDVCQLAESCVDDPIAGGYCRAP